MGEYSELMDLHHSRRVRGHIFGVQLLGAIRPGIRGLLLSRHFAIGRRIASGRLRGLGSLSSHPFPPCTCLPPIPSVHPVAGPVSLRCPQYSGIMHEWERSTQQTHASSPASLHVDRGDIFALVVVRCRLEMSASQFLRDVFGQSVDGLYTEQW